jgi:hypothetical protein
MFAAFRAAQQRQAANRHKQAPSFGTSGGPLLKTSNEAVLLAWLRSFQLRKPGERLYLNPGSRRSWFLPI